MSKRHHGFAIPALLVLFVGMNAAPSGTPVSTRRSEAKKASHTLFGAQRKGVDESQQSAGNEIKAGQSGTAPSNVCDVREFGAKGDGAHLDTAAIQSAIRACADQGGGTVRFGPGTYLSGSIQLVSNITLRLEQGARLLGSSDVGQYASAGRSSENRSTALVWAIGARNIGIEGEGSIDGNGRAFVAVGQPHISPPYYDPKRTRQGTEVFGRFERDADGPVKMLQRPGVLVLFIECENVNLREFQVLDAPNWCIHLACCRHAVINGLNVRNSLLVPNADAIDVSGCQDVRISDVYLEAGDDGIAIGSCADGYCSGAAENITVSNAVIVSRSAGIRLGYGAHDIRNLVFSNIVIRDSNRGVAVFVRDKQTIENILMSNMIIETRLMDGSWWGMGEPVHVSVVPMYANGAVGLVSNLRLVNVTAIGQAPVIIYGDRPGLIRDVLFDDFSLNISSGPLTSLYGGNLDLRPVHPTDRGIVRYDVAGLKAENVDELTLRNFTLGWKSAVPNFFRAGIEVTGFRDMTIDGFAGSGPSDDTPAIWLHNGAGATVTSARASRGRVLSYEDVTHLKADSGVGSQ